MKKFKWIIIFINLLLLLVLFNNSIVKKEAILSEGKLILLELAPVDPRSLMQGDYMRLNYKISEKNSVESISKRGFIVVKTNKEGIAERIRIQPKKTPLNNDEFLIEYTLGNWNMNIGAESFFFEEGQAEKYEKAKYGGLQVDGKGNSILVGLYNENLHKIE
ncbi:hypothetical protein EC396_09900 [Lutibacter sp. HS1-25]|uniref:GDYXXLXY domain-containing protein n=1 Tax=Lutibacter sp. HS1-25 TaxID=2485000 RepID=UPI001013C186|nr:GDYXXLXY domain-containing protein [Lutibacter sp. HS1-25]RXP53799.1 hypothetical protein EC396_09900 [Lutibacter sp. HS1-25]